MLRLYERPRIEFAHIRQRVCDDVGVFLFYLGKNDLSGVHDLVANDIAPLPRVLAQAGRAYDRNRRKKFQAFITDLADALHNIAQFPDAGGFDDQVFRIQSGGDRQHGVDELSLHGATDAAFHEFQYLQIL